MARHDIANKGSKCFGILQIRNHDRDPAWEFAAQGTELLRVASSRDDVIAANQEPAGASLSDSRGGSRNQRNWLGS